MDKFGGPVWHASGRGIDQRASRQIAIDGLRGAGDASLGQWEIEGERGIMHVQRRLSLAEQEAFAVPEPRDIRGTADETARIAAVFDEAPYLRRRFA